MDKNQLIKWALIAAAAYLIYRYVLKDGLLGGGTTPTVPPATPPVAQPPATPPGGTTVVTPPVYYTGPVDDAMLASAAGGHPIAMEAVRKVGTKLNSDQWNYYRAKGGGTVPNVDIFPEGDRGALMTIDQYLAARQSHGLSGLGQIFGRSTLAQMAAVNPWIT